MIDISFLLGSSVVASLIMQILKDIVGKIEGRYGAITTQVLLLATSFFVAGIGVLLGKLPPQILQTTGMVFASAIAIYEVIYKAIYQKAIRGE